MQVFETRRDAGLLVMVAVCIGLIIVGIVRMSMQEHYQANLFGIVVLVAAGIVLPLWMLFFTRYEITDGILVVRCGPFRYFYPASQITEVRQTRSLLAAPAWSRHRLQLSCGDYRRIMVSPRDQAGFIAALRAAGCGGQVVI